MDKSISWLGKGTTGILLACVVVGCFGVGGSLSDDCADDDDCASGYTCVRCSVCD